MQCSKGIKVIAHIHVNISTKTVLCHLYAITKQKCDVSSKSFIQKTTIHSK